jgi:hypothetical protein
VVPSYSKNPSFFGVRPHGDRKWLSHRLEVRIEVAYGSIERQDGSDIQPGSLLEPGQTIHRLCETTDPGVGIILRRHMNHGDRLATRSPERRQLACRLARRLMQGRHRLCLRPLVDRRLTPPPRLLVRSIPERNPAAFAVQ